MSEHSSDRRAAFTGLIFGAVALLILIYATVRLTNARYASEEGARKTSSASR